MMSALENLDRITAAGMLARAALAIADHLNPAAAPILPGEYMIREQLIQEARQRYGIANDESDESRVQLCDALDAESDALMEPVDDKSALERLAREGELPSDLYQIQVVSQIRDCYGRKYPQEEQNIKLTVNAPDLEQHYGPPRTPGEPHLISLFAKTFHDKYPARSFVMLVAGERRDVTLTVFQAWRVYPEDVNLIGADSPLEILKRFATVFGTDVTFGTNTGRFMFVAEVPEGSPVPIRGIIPAISGKSRREVNVTWFTQRTDSGTRAALVVAIDLDKYRDALTKRGW